MNYDHIRPSVKFRPGHFGQFRDLLEGRKFGAMAIVSGPRKIDGNLGEQNNGQTTAVEVAFYESKTKNKIMVDNKDHLATLVSLFSQNIDKFQRSAVPFFDDIARVRTLSEIVPVEEVVV